MPRSVGGLRSLALLCLASAAMMVRHSHAGEPFRLGTEADDAPFSDVGNEICRRLRLDCEWTGMGFGGLIPALLAGRIDAAVSQITVTPQRASQVMFTEAVTQTGGILIVPDLSEMTNSLSSMRGKKIGVQSGTTHETYARQVLGGVAQVRLYSTQAAAFADLLAGRIDATLCDMELGHGWLELHSGQFRFADRAIIDPARYGSHTAIALRPGSDALRAKFNEAIDGMVADGTFAAINKKYFTFSIAPATFGNPL